MWTGAQAKALGLVDSLGGFEDAVARAKVLAHISGTAQLVTFGAASSPIEAIRRALGASAQGVRTLATLGALSDDPSARAVLNRAQTARLRAGGADVLADLP